ncbi:MAG: pyridoxal-phosphate dependent enzyme [Pleurocapsa sp. MO_226.B13]|nr:pyridoxal-phosphate dependent enzyme [Pleurocapsa sp. MO_226.B13]
MSLPSFLSHLECTKCKKHYDADILRNVCECGSPLFAKYSLQNVKHSVTKHEIGQRPPNLWRYRELLPVREPSQIVSLQEGYTPLNKLPRLADFLGSKQLLLKDESTNPGDTFKARGASVSLSRAIEGKI